MPLNDVCHITFSKKIDSCDSVEKGYDILCYEVVLENIVVNENTCQNIENDYGKFLCYSKLAVKLRNPEFCKDNLNCYWNLAISTKDPDYCEYLINEAEKYKCLAKINEDVTFCENIEDEIERKSCVGLLPRGTNDCKIGDYYNYDCLYELAKKMRKSSICNLIDLEELKWTCIVDVVNNPDVCNGAGSFFEDLCRIEYLKNYFRND